jgi:cyclophilin family peptidyl-prolyl cis-trans isomerase
MTDHYVPNGYNLSPELSSERVTKFSAPGQATEPGKAYAVVLETSKGRMVAELYADKAPVTVNSFVWLMRHHYYDGIVFHRVLDGFMAQTGDPTGTGSGGPGYKFQDEFDSSLKHRGKGVLSMANAGPGTNGSQIFITFLDTPHLDGRHTVFGKITEGTEVLDKLKRIDPSRPSVGVEPDLITRAYAVEKNK